MDRHANVLFRPIQRELRITLIVAVRYDVSEHPGHHGLAPFWPSDWQKLAAERKGAILGAWRASDGG